MIQEAWLLAAAIGAIALFAGFVHSAIGFGFGIVAISLLPFVIDARSAHVVLSISSVPMLVMAAWTYREGVEKRSLLQAVLGAAIFLPLGLLLFESISLDLLVRGTGVGILFMVLWGLRGRGEKQEPKPAGSSCFLAGAISGFLAGAVSIAGPPIAAFALKQDWSQARYKAFVTQCLLIMSLYKAGLLVARSHFVGATVWQTVVAAVVAIAGVQLGAIASRGLPAERFKRIVAIALVSVSCWMILRGQNSPEAEENAEDQIELSSTMESKGQPFNPNRLKPARLD